MPAPSGTTPRLALPYPLPDDDVDVSRDVKALADRLDAGATFIVGEIRFIAVVAAPTGWLLADGREVARSAYAALFAALGVTYGAGDGSSTFLVPDLRGRSPVGAGAGAGLTSRAAGTKFGAEALVIGQVPSHSHGGGTGVDSPDHVHGATQNGFVEYRVGDAFGPGAGAVILGQFSYPTTAGASVRHAHSITAEGGGQGHWQPSLAIPAYIYAGI
jgi:microcystin-dependent protein